MEPTIRIWIIEDDPHYRKALLDLLELAEGLVAERVFITCEDALAALERTPAPEVILSDIGLPGMSGVEGVRHLKTGAPETQIIMLTVHEDEDHIFEALCAGASGYLLKHATAPRIVAAVWEVHRGGVPFTASVARKVLQLFGQGPAPKHTYELSGREQEVLQLLAGGYTQREIAEQLYLSPHTVETHLRHIYAKLHVRNGFAAVSKAVRERLI